MPENVSFASIPVDIRTPGQYIEFDNSKAVGGLPSQPRRILVMGQMLNTGTATASTPYRVFNANQAVGLFGRGSQLADAVFWAKKGNPYTEMWAVGIADNGAGVAATGT